VPTIVKPQNIDDIVSKIRGKLISLLPPQARSDMVYRLGIEKHANTITIYVVSRKLSIVALVLYGDKILAVPPARTNRLDTLSYIDKMVAEGYDPSKIQAIAFSELDGDTIVTKVYDNNDRLVLELRTRVEGDKVYLSQTKVFFHT